MAKIIDPDDLNVAVDAAIGANEMRIDTTGKTIQLQVAGNLSNDGGTIQALYSFLKEEWKANTTLIKFPFPLKPIDGPSGTQFNLVQGWDWADQTTKDLIRDGGWAFKNDSGISLQEYCNITSLGAFHNSGTDQAYYTQSPDGTPTDIALAGEVNQAIRIFDLTAATTAMDDFAFDNSAHTITRGSGSFITDGYTNGTGVIRVFGAEDSANDGLYEIVTVTALVITVNSVTTPISVTNANDTTANFKGGEDLRSFFKLFLREEAKIYDQYDLITEQNLSSLTYKKYALPLSNSADQKVSASDGTIGAGGIYSLIDVTYLVGNGYVVATVTSYVEDDVIQDTAGRWAICTSAGTLDAAGVADYTTNGGTSTFVAFTGERQIGANYYAFNKIIEGDTRDLVNVYEKIQYQLRQTTDIDEGAGVVRGDIADLLLVYSGDQLVTEAGVFVDSIASTEINSIDIYDINNVKRSFPFVAAMTLNFNSELQLDPNAIYKVFFTNNDAGDNDGNDFGTTGAIIVQDDSLADVAGNISASSSIQFTYDYDGNVQRGAGSSGVDAPVTVVALGLDGAQHVVAIGTILRSKTNAISLVSAEELTYQNPL